MRIVQKLTMIEAIVFGTDKNNKLLTLMSCNYKSGKK
jgi:hypothetical protein